MNITVIDGHGGLLGAQLIKEISQQFPQTEITAIGTNASATAAMLKAGASKGATGENPVIVACRHADIIIGPIGIVIANALLGEITPNIATAIGSSKAYKILIPMNKCNHYVVGCAENGLAENIRMVCEKVEEIL